MDNSKPKCCARIWDSMWRKHKTCSRFGKIERDGKNYCGLHDPVVIAQKQAERNAAFHQKFEESKRVRRLHDAAPDLLEALERLLSEWSYQETLGNVPNDRIEVAKAAAAIAKAKGESV